jgi:NAD(P)H dehydrogenase (quinone)
MTDRRYLSAGPQLFKTCLSGNSASNERRRNPMRIFIVHAHHEPKSFNGAMTETAVAALGDAGHEVIVSDLYRMAFDPVSDRRNFTTVRDAAYLKQQAEESFAHQHHGFAPPIAAELEKLFWCEALIF